MRELFFSSSNGGKKMKLEINLEDTMELIK